MTVFPERQGTAVDVANGNGSFRHGEMKDSLV
jgi:hypothetical protein